MREKEFQNKIIEYFRAHTAWVFNIHGSEWQMSGVPDLLIIHRRWRGFLELKMGTKPSDLQKKVIRDIKAREFPAWVLKPDGIYDEDGAFISEWNWGNLLEVLCQLQS